MSPPRMVAEPEWRAWAESPTPWSSPTRFIVVWASDDELPSWLEMERRHLLDTQGRLSRARARGGFYRTRDGAQRLLTLAMRSRHWITAYSAELRARQGEILARHRCEWLLAVVLWRRDFRGAWDWAERLRHEIERIEASLVRGTHFCSGAPLAVATRRKYKRRLPEARDHYAEALERVRGHLRDAPVPYFQDQNARDRWSERRLSARRSDLETTVTPEDTLREAGISDSRQDTYQRRMSMLLDGRQPHEAEAPAIPAFTGQELMRLVNGLMCLHSENPTEFERISKKILRLAGLDGSAAA